MDKTSHRRCLNVYVSLESPPESPVGDGPVGERTRQKSHRDNTQLETMYTRTEKFDDVISTDCGTAADESVEFIPISSGVEFPETRITPKPSKYDRWTVYQGTHGLFTGISRFGPRPFGKISK